MYLDGSVFNANNRVDERFCLDWATPHAKAIAHGDVSTPRYVTACLEAYREALQIMRIIIKECISYFCY